MHHFILNEWLYNTNKADIKNEDNDYYTPLMYAVAIKDNTAVIDYLVKKMGLDHVGISSDFDGGGGIYGWNDASETLNVTAELVKRGYTEAQIAQLWSGNLLRVLDDVAAIAKELQAADKV